MAIFLVKCLVETIIPALSAPSFKGLAILIQRLWRPNFLQTVFTSNIRTSHHVLLLISCLNIDKSYPETANSIDPDQTSPKDPSDRGLCYLRGSMLFA